MTRLKSSPEANLWIRYVLDFGRENLLRGGSDERAAIRDEKLQ